MERRGGMAGQSFSTRMAARILAISPARIRYWVKRKLVTPTATQGRNYQFSFEDLLRMRLTKELLPNGGRVLPLKQCFDRLGRVIDQSRPLTSLKLYQRDGHILARDGAAQFEADSGQLLLALTSDSGQPLGKLDGPARMRRLLQSAAELEETDPLRALKLYHEYVEHEPEDSAIHRRLSRLFETCGDLSGAIRHLETVVRLEPGEAEVHFDLGVMYRKQSDLTRAEENFLRALECDANLIEAHLHLAEIYERQSRPRDSFRHLSAAHRLMNNP
jgi:tetratricopeptide (TPR) repeat protein